MLTAAIYLALVAAVCVILAVEYGEFERTK